MKLLAIVLILVFDTPLMQAKDVPPVNDDLPARIVEREHQVTKSLEKFHPIVETYIQVQNRQGNEMVPSYDRHSISLAQFSGQLQALRFKPREAIIRRYAEENLDGDVPTRIQYDPSGFVAEAYPAPETFDLKHYRFEYLTKEFLGEVRCLVFEVKPIPMRKHGLFEGRIWVEDQSNTIVRFNGRYRGSNLLGIYFHFDSWRVNSGPGLWLPAVIYSSETERPCCGFWKVNWMKLSFKAHTRFWGYDLHFPQSEDEFGKIIIDPSSSIQDQSNSSEYIGPAEEQQKWEAQAENNVAEQLERLGLLSPVGDVEKTLQTVVNNIEVTNDLFIEPEVRCRVLLTSNLESTVVGHTIILSRGLIDVLPTEAALAEVLAVNLAHIKLGERADTRFSFADTVMFSPRETVRKLHFVHTHKQEQQAYFLAQEWMLSSPYHDSLDSVAGFIAELRLRSRHISKLLKANIGDSVYDAFAAAQVDAKSVVAKNPSRIHAFPLSSTMVLDPWSDKTMLVRGRNTVAQSKSENTPFEVTPFVLYLRRVQDDKTSEVSFPVSANN